MIDLNCKAPVRMTGVTLPYIPRGGRIVEVCSTAAFQPFPYLNVYAASKAFLCRYSRALGRELRGAGDFGDGRLPLLGEGHRVYWQGPLRGRRG